MVMNHEIIIFTLVFEVLIEIILFTILKKKRSAKTSYKLINDLEKKYIY